MLQMYQVGVLKGQKSVRPRRKGKGKKLIANNLLHTEKKRRERKETIGKKYLISKTSAQHFYLLVFNICVSMSVRTVRLCVHTKLPIYMKTTGQPLPPFTFIFETDSLTGLELPN